MRVAWAADFFLLTAGIYLLAVAWRGRRRPPVPPARDPYRKYPDRSVVIDGYTTPSRSLMRLLDEERAGFDHAEAAKGRAEYP
jgi:hypothetical protein